MNIPFFTDYLMLSNPLSIGIIAVFVLALIGIYVLQRKGTSFGNLVIIGTIVGAILGIAVQIIAGFPDDPSKVVYIKESNKWVSLGGGRLHRFDPYACYSYCIYFYRPCYLAHGGGC